MIRKNFVLTAAHCIVKKSTVRELRSPVLVSAGEFSTDQLSNETAIPASRLFPHEFYDNTRKTADYDIGLIKLERDVSDEYTKIARLISVPRESGAPVFVVGWGMTENFEKTDKLRYVEMVITESCRKKRKSKIPESIVCIKGDLQNPCSGDSGGPYFDIRSEQSVHTIMAVHSMGHINGTGACVPGKKYTGVSVYYFKKWIEEKLARTDLRSD